ncbi:MAG: serine/threonine-protein kinase [Deltaproteobacteria bacterium]|nr:serine/threonine-protein kinase [Deltaproteobacteria bacterium]
MSAGAATEAPLSRFTRGRELGQGGMATVFAAVDNETGTTVALKLLAGVLEEEARARFLREVRTSAALKHDNVCRLIAYGLKTNDDDANFIAMELVDGDTLHAFSRTAKKASMVDPRRALPARVAAEVLRQLLAGLGSAHALTVLHRDLKPGNVMIARDGTVKLLDFGIARSMGDETVTKTGDVVGTPAFMSPEQVQALPLDPRSDLFSLGVTIQSALRGTHRFQGLDATQMFLRAAFEPTAPLIEDAPGTPTGLDSVLAAMTALAPEARVPSTLECAAMLDLPRHRSPHGRAGPRRLLAVRRRPLHPRRRRGGHLRRRAHQHQRVLPRRRRRLQTADPDDPRRQPRPPRARHCRQPWQLRVHLQGPRPRRRHAPARRRGVPVGRR